MASRKPLLRKMQKEGIVAKLLKAAEVTAILGERAAQKLLIVQNEGIVPQLVIVRVGARPDDLMYERNVLKRCEALGVSSKVIELPEVVEQEQLEQTIRKLNADASVHGVLLFRPLPAHLDEKACAELLEPKKDIDELTSHSLARAFTASAEGFLPCTAQACREILEYYQIPLEGKKVCVLGRSLVVGKPAAMLMLEKNATVTICHSKTENPQEICKCADVLIVATGRTNSVGKEYVSPGQTVIDVGIGWSEELQKMCGDVRFDEVEPIVGAITPVPGGVGGVTTFVLIEHVIDAALAMSAKRGL